VQLFYYVNKNYTIGDSPAVKVSKKSGWSAYWEMMEAMPDKKSMESLETPPYRLETLGSTALLPP
jgi:hypothetical protein